VSGLTSEKTYLALAVVNAGDAVACTIPLPFIAKILDDLEIPPDVRWVIPVVKAAAAVGLLSVLRFPGLARLATAMLTLYFVLAVGAHARVRDRFYNAIPAAVFLVTFATMTAKGPADTH
jgi:hypothetical protein